MQYCFSGKQKSRGAKRKYAGKVKLEDLSKLELVKEIEKDVKLYTSLVYWMNNSQLIRIAVLVNFANPNKIGYCILFCSDINLDPLDIVLFIVLDFKLNFFLEMLNSLLVLVIAKLAPKKNWISISILLLLLLTLLKHISGRKHYK